MKMLAAIMDITRLKFFRHGYVARRTMKCLVYDPRKVSGWDLEKRKSRSCITKRKHHERTKQIR